MTTDFTYNGYQIVSGGPFKPSGKDMPSDARTRVESYADIATIPNPHVGLKITVKADETNNNKMTDYIVKSLKANSMGVADSAINEVVRYVDYLGASSGGGVSQEDINTAVNKYLTEHPVASGATTEQVAQIEANTNAIGTEELSTTAKTLKGAINEVFQSVSSGKTLIASAITDKGVSTSNNDTFQTMANNIKSISTGTQEVNYTFDTVAEMKSDSSPFVEGDIIKVNGYYSTGDLVESTLKYRVMTYDNWLLSLPEDMRYASYSSGWWGYKYIKLFVDEYGNHTLKNGLVAKLIIEDGIVYAEQYGCVGDGVTLDNTAIRHLFGLNKRNITIKFQEGKTYVIGTEKFNVMYYDEDKFNLIKDNNLLANKIVCGVNEYFTQGGQRVGGWCQHVKPCLTNV